MNMMIGRKCFDVMIRSKLLVSSVLTFFLFLTASAECANTIVIQDLPTGIKSNMGRFVSFRYMRHVWITPGENVCATVVQQGGYNSHSLALYRTTDGGLNWEFALDISQDFDLISDGVLDVNNDILLVPTDFVKNKIVDVTFIRLVYEPLLKTWTIAPASPRLVFQSDANMMATRATVAIDGNGVIWITFRVHDVVNDTWFFKVSYSNDDGVTWQDSGCEFGNKNAVSEKCAKILAVGSGVGLVYQDSKILGSTEYRLKKWAYRDNTQGLGDPWQEEQIIAQMYDQAGDVYGSHWSVAADWSGNVHLSFQDYGIRYAKYVGWKNAWEPSVPITANGIYSNISVGVDNDVFLAQDVAALSHRYLFGKQFDAKTGAWSTPFRLSHAYSGKLRMCLPEKFKKNLPILFQTEISPPYELMYTLIQRN
jgi:hypothetical protein